MTKWALVTLLALSALVACSAEEKDSSASATPSPLLMEVARVPEVARSPAPAMPAKISLIGVLKRGDKSLALLSMAGSPQLFAAGEDIEAGWKLTRILTDCVELVSGAAQSTLCMGGGSVASDRPKASDAPFPSVAASMANSAPLIPEDQAAQMNQPFKEAVNRKFGMQ